VLAVRVNRALHDWEESLATVDVERAAIARTLGRLTELIEAAGG